jgi:hypothetical protein
MDFSADSGFYADLAAMGALAAMAASRSARTGWE